MFWKLHSKPLSGNCIFCNKWGFVCIGNLVKVKEKDSTAFSSVNFPFPTQENPAERKTGKEK